jgi:hypothetical protein
MPTFPTGVMRALLCIFVPVGRSGGNGLHWFCHLLPQPRRDGVPRPAAIRRSRCDRRAGSVPHAAGAVPALPRRRDQPWRYPVDRRRARRHETRRIAVVLAVVMDTQPNPSGPHLHRWCRPSGLQREDPVDVPRTGRSGERRTESPDPGPSSRRLRLVPGRTVLGHWLYRSTWCAIVCINHRRPTAWLLATVPPDRQAHGAVRLQGRPPRSTVSMSDAASQVPDTSFGCPAHRGGLNGSAQHS